MKNLYSFYADCGRMGDLEGLFVSTPEDIEACIGEEVQFGEVLGKHSDIEVILSEENFSLISDDQEKIEWLTKCIGRDTISGLNPLEYIEIES